jgi:phosphate transport system substrate-binding protein
MSMKPLKVMLSVSVLASALFIPVAGLAGDAVRLHGATTTQKSVIDPGKEALQKTGVKLDVVGSTTGAGLEDLVGGKCDLAMAAEALPDAIANLKNVSAGIQVPDNLKEFVIGKSNLVVIVNKENPVAKLSGEQLGALLTGKTANWKDVGGADKPVVVIAAPIGTATRKILQKQLMGGADFAAGTIDSETPAKQVDYIDTNPEGIAVVADTLLKSSAKKGAVKVVEAPEISFQLTLVSKGEPAGDVKKVVDFYTGPGKK